MDEKLAKAPHHHGNLPQALVAAGIALLREGGPEALTLRRCAAMAEVSHAAPAHHFDGIAGLRAAIAAEGFRIFTAAMLKERDAAPASPRARLRAICRGYLRFAEDEPALFDLIFGFDARQKQRHNPAEAGIPAYDVLRDACAPFAPGGEAPEIVEAQVWSLIHGYAALRLSGRFRNDAPANFDRVMALLDRVGTEP